ncbi:MAG: ADP/ATP-dependent (S)-NAD(P)H-hydrate dehydratase [Lacisediminihabitans sp.]
MAAYREWTPADARGFIAEPVEGDDKYSRGVLGIVTGSTRYPGAAVLGVEAALRTGLGMVRYLGPAAATSLVLQRRPEAVTSTGRVQAWLLGSGMDATERDEATNTLLTDALGQAVPTVLDAGALDLLHDAAGPVVITPHLGELARVLGREATELSQNPGEAARRAANELGVTVLLKGHRTYIAVPDGTGLTAASAPSWTATAGTGDALGGILGALLATHSRSLAKEPPGGLLARLAATAAVLHGLAATRASGGGPFVVLDLAAALPVVISELLAEYPAAS